MPTPTAIKPPKPRPTKQEHYNKMMAEVLGKSGGYCKGKGGSMHIADVAHGNLGATGIVGGNIPVAIGAALAQKLLDTDRVVLCFFGDGASNTGNFHESLNMACLWDLPVVFVVENNLYAMSVPWTKASKLQRISDRACAYGIPGVTVDGMDVLAVREAVAEAVERARRGQGPTLIECQDLPLVRPLALRPAQLPHPRRRSRTGSDRDPIQNLHRRSERGGDADRGRVRAGWKKPSQDKLDEAMRFSEASPEPDAGRAGDGRLRARQNHRPRMSRRNRSCASGCRADAGHAPDLLCAGPGRSACARR